MSSANDPNADAGPSAPGTIDAPFKLSSPRKNKRSSPSCAASALTNFARRVRDSSSDSDVEDRPGSPQKVAPKSKSGTAALSASAQERSRHEYSGYSTSSENSEYEIVPKDKLQLSVDDPFGGKSSPRIRKRRNRKTDETGQQQQQQQLLVYEQPTGTTTTLPDELQSRVLEAPERKDHNQTMAVKNESDISLDTEESCDEFWRSGKLVDSAADRTRSAGRSSKRKKESTKKWFGSVRDILNEWSRFKEDHKEDLRILRLARNECILELFLMFMFCGVGGIIFRTTEGAFETFYKCGVKRVKRDFLDTLWDKRYMREDEWKSLARSKLMSFENQLYDAYEAGLTSYSGQKGWSFVNSIFYVLTVVTTIGYGHMAPVTSVGRIATIIYALFGIPMFLILLADYGKLFTRSIKFVWAFIRRLYYTGSCRKVRRTIPVQEVIKGMQMMYDMTTRRDSSREGATIEPNTSVQANMTPDPSCTPALSAYTIDDTFNLPISVAFVILLLYMIAGAYIFSFTENWEFLDSFYFVFISTSTIGFGDIVPEGQICAMLISLIYFIFGLALTSMFINVIQEKLSDSFKQATAKIGATMGFEVPYVETGQPVLADPEQ